MNTTIKDIDRIENYIALPTILSYEYSPDAPQSVHFNIHFEAETEIVIVAETDSSISKVIAGNVYFDDGSKVYPSINVSNGYGSITLKYDKPGTLKIGDLHPNQKKHSP